MVDSAVTPLWGLSPLFTNSGHQFHEPSQLIAASSFWPTTEAAFLLAVSKNTIGLNAATSRPREPIMIANGAKIIPPHQLSYSILPWNKVAAPSITIRKEIRARRVRRSHGVRTF